jgi:hypothetical protein
LKTIVLGLGFVAAMTLGCEQAADPTPGEETPTAGRDEGGSELLLQLDPNAQRETKQAGALGPRTLPYGTYTYCWESNDACESRGLVLDPNNCNQCISDDDRCTIQIEGELGGGGTSAPAYGSLHDTTNGQTTGRLTWGSYRLSQAGTRYLVTGQYQWGSYDIATAVRPVPQGGLGCTLTSSTKKSTQWLTRSNRTVRTSFAAPVNAYSSSNISAVYFYSTGSGYNVQ